MRITIKDVAREAGVSHMTVSRVINKKTNISEKTRFRVLEAIRKLGYKPNTIARSLVMKETRLIGMIVPDIDNPFFSAMVRGTEKLTCDNEYNTILGDTGGLVKNEERYLDLMVQRMVDGVVLAAPRMDESLLERYREMIPIVVLDRHMENTGITHVWANNVEGVQLGMDHLIELGHRRIGFITGPQNVQVSLMREEGYRKSLQNHGIPFNSEIVLQGDYLFDSGYRSLDKFFSLPYPPTGIFCSNDIMALGLLKRAKEKNIRIPEDLSVVGFDNIGLASLISPPLTTVHHPIIEMGKTGITLLLNRIMNNLNEVDEVRMKNDLVVRESTRRPRS